MDFERVPLHGIDCGSCHWISNECELYLKWISSTTMPENLASNSANLQPVGMHVMHDVHNYVSDCAVVGVPLSDTDSVSDTRQSLSQSHSDSRYRHGSRRLLQCFHEKFEANSRAKFVHCHINLWCLVYESARSAYRWAVMMIRRECQNSERLWLIPSLW